MLVTPTCATLLASAIDTELPSLFTVMETFAVAVSPELFCVPVTTYEVTGEYTAVPEITPVVVLSVNPLDSAGLIE